MAFDARLAMMNAVRDAGFRPDTRAVHAYKLPGVEDWRVDFSGKRSARLEHRDARGAWNGVSNVIYYGHVRSDEFAKAWATWAARWVRGERGAEPVSERTPGQKRALEKSRERGAREAKKREKEEEETKGPGFYVIHGTQGSLYNVMSKPQRSLDVAISLAFDAYAAVRRAGSRGDVKVVETDSKYGALVGRGHVWWINGQRKGAPVHPAQQQMPWADRRRRR